MAVALAACDSQPDDGLSRFFGPRFAGATSRAHDRSVPAVSSPVQLAGSVLAVRFPVPSPLTSLAGWLAPPAPGPTTQLPALPAHASGWLGSVSLLAGWLAGVPILPVPLSYPL
jgi:hypothetical protein